VGVRAARAKMWECEWDEWTCRTCGTCGSATGATGVWCCNFVL